MFLRDPEGAGLFRHFKEMGMASRCVAKSVGWLITNEGECDATRFTGVSGSAAANEIIIVRGQKNYWPPFVNSLYESLARATRWLICAVSCVRTKKYGNTLSDRFFFSNYLLERTVAVVDQALFLMLDKL